MKKNKDKRDKLIEAYETNLGLYKENKRLEDELGTYQRAANRERKSKEAAENRLKELTDTRLEKERLEHENKNLLDANADLGEQLRKVKVKQEYNEGIQEAADIEVLHQRVDELEIENSNLVNQNADLANRLKISDDADALLTTNSEDKIIELEAENEKLKSDLKTVSAGSMAKTMRLEDFQVEISEKKKEIKKLEELVEGTDASWKHQMKQNADLEKRLKDSIKRETETEIEHSRLLQDYEESQKEVRKLRGDEEIPF